MAKRILPCADGFLDITEGISFSGSDLKVVTEFFKAGLSEKDIATKVQEAGGHYFDNSWTQPNKIIAYALTA